MIPGRPSKILIVDDSTRSNAPARTLMLKGHDVLLLKTDMVDRMIAEWPDIVVLPSPNFVVQSVLVSTYLTHAKVIKCYD